MKNIYPPCVILSITYGHVNLENEYNLGSQVFKE